MTRMLQTFPACHPEERRISDHFRREKGNSQRFFVPLNDRVEAVHSERGIRALQPGFGNGAFGTPPR